MRYLVVTERGESSWGAHVPDLPGCIAVGDTEEEVLDLISEAIDAHIELMQRSGEPVPEPRTYPHLVEVAG
ncbi:MAG: type II toxin-antitoxin system HicB family antitoxin [Armatimonadetes bacterium]|nr:type II toxin-antitoxin system HicB family antitoxin [Armatimonadota bacterium]